MDLQLENKLALVSGSTAGIGYAIAASLAQEGASVIINGRTRERVQEAIASLQNQGSGKLLEFVADLSAAEAATEAAEQFPDVDILVNNLGIFEPKPFLEIADAEWLRFFEVNVMSGVRLARAYFPRMIERNWGRILFISSESGVQIPTEMIHYGMTKTAQIAVARGLAQMTTGTNVTVNSILGGPTKSEGVTKFLQQMAQEKNTDLDTVEKNFFQSERPTSLLQRFASTQEVANLVTYVASPLSSATNGAALRVEGGVIQAIL